MYGFKLSRMVFFSTIIVCSQANIFSPVAYFPDNAMLNFERYHLWFMDVQNKRSIAMLFGRAKPLYSKNGSRHIFIGLLYDDAKTSHPLQYNAFPTANVLNITTLRRRALPN